MNPIQQDIFIAALKNLAQRIESLTSEIEGDDTPDIAAFDDRLEVVLEARNAYCAQFEIAIDDGEIRWDESAVQAKEDDA